MFLAHKDEEVTVLHEPSYSLSSNTVNTGIYSKYKFNDDLSGSIQEHNFNFATKPKSGYATNAIDRIDKNSIEPQVISGKLCLLYVWVKTTKVTYLIIY